MHSCRARWRVLRCSSESDSRKKKKRRKIKPSMCSRWRGTRSGRKSWSRSRLVKPGDSDPSQHVMVYETESSAHSPPPPFHANSSSTLRRSEKMAQASLTQISVVLSWMRQALWLAGGRHETGQSRALAITPVRSSCWDFSKCSGCVKTSVVIKAYGSFLQLRSWL